MHTACLSREEARQFIEEQRERAQSNKVLHSHPSPLYWRANDSGLTPRLTSRAKIARVRRMRVNLYLGIPYCLPTDPPHCGFCLFPTEAYEGKAGMEAYLSYLEREAALYRPYYRADTLESIYVGGGTPNLMRESDYGRLMDVVRALYDSVPDGIEKTIEGIPQLFSLEKVRAIKQAGFTRVSMGVQQLGDDLIKHSGRAQTKRQVMEALEYFAAAGLSCNVDLIYGWPEQTMHDMLRDLEEIVASGVRHITHYELNIAGKSDFSRSRRALLPSLQNRIEMYQASVAFLESRGYRQATVYDWEKIDPAEINKYAYEENLRGFLRIENGEIVETANMIGLGMAGISFPWTWPAKMGPNWAQMNCRSLGEYCAALQVGRFPIERSFVYELADLKLAWLFQAIQEMKIDCTAYDVAFARDGGAGIHAEFAPVWDELEERGWIARADGYIRFLGLGQYHIPMLQSLLSAARLRQLRTVAVGRRIPEIVSSSACG